ncbi:hypothetical protein R50073_11600 [Maricurvus nonylphenolicus]|uniref:glutathione S-transferase family protein n=1 Tax=Maricurvus nonylphenolicus TaxID=1008307 RepID=UPI0036F24300
MDILPLCLLIVSCCLLVWYLVERNRRKTRPMPEGLNTDRVIPTEQPWELYHNNLSLCSKKIRVCLAELKIPYKAHHIDLIETGSYQNISREFLKVNPAALVPVLIHNGHPIYESHAQLQYAAEHSATPAALVPADPDKKRLMEYWVTKGSLIGDDPLAALEASAGNTIPGLTLPLFGTMIERIPVKNILEGLLFHRLKERPLGFLLFKLVGAQRFHHIPPIRKAIQQSRDALNIHLDELEAVLAQSEGPWITGKQFTLADVGMMVIFERLLEADWIKEFLTERRPQIGRYWASLQTRPSYQSAIAEFDHPTISRGLDRLQTIKRHYPAFNQAITADPAC